VAPFPRLLPRARVSSSLVVERADVYSTAAASACSAPDLDRVGLQSAERNGSRIIRPDERADSSGFHGAPERPEIPSNDRELASRVPK